MLRKAFKTGAWKLWSVKRLQKLGNLLQSHHGSSIPKHVKQKLTRRANTLTMLNAWKCWFCWVQVEGHLTHCKGCNRHWRQADFASNQKTGNGRATRSQSKRRHSRQESNSKDVENSEKNKNKEEEMVFTSKLPWVVNSPQTRVTTVEIPAAEATETAASTEPQMPASPNVEEDINQVLQHLRGLKQALGSLPRELEEKLQTYEERVKDRALTHGHLNRLGKITKQLKGIATRLTAMDEGWISFSKRVKDKYEHHKVLYHQSREELLRAYIEKSQELQAAKEQIQHASHQLSVDVSLNQPPVVPPTDAVENSFTESMEEDQMTVEEMNLMYPSNIQLEAMDGMEEIFEDGPRSPDPPKQSIRKDALRPFSRGVAHSPSKVAQLHLKQKEADKEKSKGGKATTLS